jgi:hypothetical protein
MTMRTIRFFPRLRLGTAALGTGIAARHRSFLARRWLSRRGHDAAPLPLVLRQPARWSVRNNTVLLRLAVQPARTLLVHRQTVRLQAGAAGRAAGATARVLHSRHVQHELRIEKSVRLVQPMPTALPIRPLAAGAPALPVRRPAALPHEVLRTRIERQAAYPRLPAALARSPSAEAARSASARAASVADREESVRGPAGRTAAEPPKDWSLPPMELARITSRLTDHVIEQLERRALSYRERGGGL